MVSKTGWCRGRDLNPRLGLRFCRRGQPGLQLHHDTFGCSPRLSYRGTEKSVEDEGQLRVS